MDPKVLEAIIKLLPPNLLESLFPVDETRTNFCNEQDPAVRTINCLRPKGHNGPHVAHGNPDEPISIWTNELYWHHKFGFQYGPPPWRNPWNNS